MCGIAGIVGGEADGLREDIAAMAHALRHRGPDGQKSVCLEGIALGHARLSIIDLSGGWQPMQSVDGRYWIVFNGEIYNYRALREELLKRGHVFQTESDTEVLLEWYRAEGAEGLSALNGMFSFAIWDVRDRTLFAARDRMGKKPFYHARGAAGEFLFASEIKALLATSRCQARLDPEAADAYLMLGYVPPNRTIYANISTLPPGSFLRLSGGTVQTGCYWSPRFQVRRRTLPEAVEEMRAAVQEAVRMRLLASDVPVGVFLSGGLDSSTVAALAQRVSTRPLDSFGVHIADHYDETPFAREVAGREGLCHHDVMLQVDPVEALSAMADIYDEPFGDASNIPTYLLSKFARQSVKVVLTGDGGDELFAGYEHAYLPLLQESAVPNRGLGYHGLRLLDAGLERGLARAHLASPLRPLMHLADQARITPDPLARHVRRVERIRETSRQAIWHTERRFQPSHAALPADTSGLDRALWFDTTSYLAGDILVKVDRAAMAVGLETRSPLLDPRVVELALSLPVGFKVARGVCKSILREAFGDLWPASLRSRRKMGFGVPEDVWLRTPALRAFLQDQLQSAAVRAHGLLDHAEAQKMIDAYYRRAGVSATQLWTLLCFITWMHRWKPAG